MIEIFKDKAGEYRYRIKGANGEVMVSSEGYTRKADALRGVHDLMRVLQTVTISQVKDQIDE